ncbi:hypothetical protein Tco_0175995, partial [Tanacetum coccineum]
TDTSYLQSDTQSLVGHVSPTEWCHVARYYSAADRSTATDWSTATGPPVNGGQRQQSTAVNAVEPPPNGDGQRWSTMVNGAEPPLSTDGASPDHRLMAMVNDGQRWSTVLNHR